MLQFENEMQYVDRYISQNIFQNVLKIEQLYKKSFTYANVAHLNAEYKYFINSMAYGSN